MEEEKDLEEQKIEPQKVEDKQEPNKKQKVKKEKVKKEKVQKEKKPKRKLTKKQIVAIVVSAISLVLCAVIGVGIYFLVIFSKKLPTPTNLNVYNFNDSVFIEVDEYEKAEKYTFIIKPTNVINPIVMTVDTNKVDVSELFKEPDTYTISAKYLGKLEKATSDETEKIEYVSQIQLETPTIRYDETTGILSWVPIKGATSYKVYYDSEDFVSRTATNLEANETFDIDTFFENTNSIVAGIYTVKVMAVGDEHHINSNLSEKVDVEYGEQIEQVTELTYNKTTKIVSFVRSTSATGYKIILYTGTSNDSTTNEFSIDANQNSANVTPYIGSLVVYKVEVIALGDGNYSRDSVVTTYIVP